MKKVKSLADLRRHALSTGAELEIDGTRFNTSATRLPAGAALPPKPPASDPPPPPPPPPPAPVQDLLPDLIGKQAASMEALVSKMLSAVTAARTGAAPITAWAFDVKYGKDGEIVHVLASARSTQ